MDRKERQNVCQCAQDKFLKLCRDICQKKTRFMNKPAPANQRYKPTNSEHAANCVTHAVCILPSIVGSTALHLLSDEKWHSLAAWFYGAGLCGLFIVSTIFHIITWKIAHHQTIEHCLHMCDRVVIYIFIAASYTPWLLLRQLGPWGVPMRWFVWVMACAGTLYVILYHERYKVLELLCYLTMGFAPLVAIFSMSNTEGLAELAFGGVVYCLGVAFFKSDGVFPFAHAIWHVFVAIAAMVHYYAIWKHLYRVSPT